MGEPQLAAKKLNVSNHAILRAKQRFGCKSDSDAANFVKSKLGSGARYIGEISSAEGDRAHMYVQGNTAIYVSIDLETVKSIYDLDSKGHYPLLKPKIEALYHKEFRKLDRLEKARFNKLKLLEHKNNYEIAALKYRAFRSRSQNVKNECALHIQKLSEEIENCKVEIEQIQGQKRLVARAIATEL